MRPITHHELPALLSAIPPHSPFGPRDYAALILDQYTGLRVSELCGLNVGNVATRSGEPRELLDLPASLGKGGKGRVIPLHSAAQAAILAILRFNAARGFSTAPGAPLLVNRKGQFLPVRTFQHILQGYRQAADLSPEITCHSFRHHMAIELTRVCGNLQIVQLILGHERLETTRIYTRPSVQDMTSAVHRLA